MAGMLAERDEERDREVAKYNLGDDAHPDLDDLAHLAAQVTGRPIVMINVMSADTQRTVAAVGVGRDACARKDSLCNAVLYDGQTVEVRDVLEEPRWADNPFVNGVLASFRFYYAHQLVSPRGVVIGTLCVFDVQPHVLDDVQKYALGQIARWIIDVLELRLRTGEMEEVVSELVRTRGELERSNHMLGLFASQVAHDLRGPITALTASLGMLRDEDPPLSESQDWLVGHAISGVQRMDALVGEVLRTARLDGELRMTYVDLAELADLVCEDLAIELGTIDVVAQDLPTVVGDATQMRIVLQNLVSNAARFVRAVPSPWVHLAAGFDDKHWWLQVSDNGPGVPAADRERVWEPMQRGSDQSAVHALDDDASNRGLGLGLATCRRIVQAHGGTITMGATTGGGALVTLAIPITRAGQVQAALNAATDGRQLSRPS